MSNVDLPVFVPNHTAPLGFTQVPLSVPAAVARIYSKVNQFPRRVAHASLYLTGPGKDLIEVYVVQGQCAVAKAHFTWDGDYLDGWKSSSNNVMWNKVARSTFMKAVSTLVSTSEALV